MMDPQQHKNVHHLEEADPLPPEVDFDKKEKETVTFWRRTHYPIEDKLSSETDSEGKYCWDIYHPQSSEISFLNPDNYENYDVISLSETLDETINEKEIFSKYDKPESGEEFKSQFSDDAPKSLQSLSDFFTEVETRMVLPTDSMLSIKDKYFVVLPSSSIPGYTLFQCVCQFISGSGNNYHQIKENVVNYICSQEGWDLMGKQVVSYYKTVIDEFQCTTEEGDNCDLFLKRAYKHYFLDEKMEGSLIELVAASILYRFRYTCIFLQETETEIATCRIFFSDNEDVTLVNNGITKRRSSGEMIYFLRVGDCPDNWEWSLVRPYHHDYGIHQLKICPTITRGNYEVHLWNVYGLTWDTDSYIVKRTRKNIFRWKHGTSVICTKSGKLLGRYITSRTDLFSNLCWILSNCPHDVNNCCLLRDAVKYCSSKEIFAKVNDPVAVANLIMKTKDIHTRKHSQVRIESKSTTDLQLVGTLKDLRKAAKMFNFGYYVIGIDEYGDFETLARRDKQKVIYLLARTSYDIVIEWCILDDMRTFKTFGCTSKESLQIYSVPQSELSQTSLAERTTACSCPSETNFLMESNPKCKRKHEKLSTFRNNISRYFSHLHAYFSSRINGRRFNKVYQDHDQNLPSNDTNLDPDLNYG